MIQRTQQAGELSPPVNRKNFDITASLAVEAARIAATDRRPKKVRIGKKDVYAHWLMSGIEKYNAGEINPLWIEHGERMKRGGQKPTNRLKIAGGLSIGVVIPSGYNDMLKSIHERVQMQIAPESITQTSVMVCLMLAVYKN
jgi:hypothetical protein